MKRYKGYELMKAITNGEIKEGTEFLIKNKTKVYYDGRILRYKEMYCDIAPNTEIGMSWLTGEFELIEETKEIEELGLYEEFIQEPFEHIGHLEYKTDTIEMHDKINELVRAVNKIIKEREGK